MKNKQTSELALEREFLLEEMLRYLIAKPEEATKTALEIYNAYLNLNAQHLELMQENHQLQEGIRTRIETPPFFGKGGR